jgi:hypothetical protein
MPFRTGRSNEAAAHPRWLHNAWQRRRLRGRTAAEPLLAYLASPQPERDQDWRNGRYLALDLETTGGEAGRDDILSFGWLCLDGPEIRLASARHRLVQPRRNLSEENVSIHRITDDQAAEGESLRVVLADFLADLQGRVLIAHYSPTEHPVDQDGTGLLAAAHLHVVADGEDAGEHRLQIAGDGDFLHRVGDLAVLDPVAGGAARVVAGDVVDAVAEQFGDQQAAPMRASSRRGRARRAGMIRLWLPPALPVVCMPSLRAV